MRSFPEDYLCMMIAEMIHNSVSFPYTKFINTIKCGNTSVLIAPSNSDKAILLRAIIEYLTVYTEFSDEYMSKCIENLVKVYNESNMTTISRDSIPFMDLLCFNTLPVELWHMLDINFISEEDVRVIKSHYKNRTRLTDDIINLIKIQMFIFASVYMNMDELLIYLYKIA